MAKFLSKPPSTATNGERVFFIRVAHAFTEEDHVIGYFEPNIGGLHPDFLFLSPKFGILIVEVKDYSENYLNTVPISGEWERLKDNKTVLVSNPFDQLYQYWRAIKDRINYCHFPEGINIPIFRLAVFSQISQNNRIAEMIRSVVPRKIHLCFKEIINKNKDCKEFFSDILPRNFQLSNEHFELLRANIIPTCRLPTLSNGNLLEYFTTEDKVKLLDQKQERLARELGEGHRLIFGVAGSGKTVLIIARARILARRHPDWKILVLCYNRLLKELLFHLLNPQDYEADITINTYHGWARSYILSAGNHFSKLYREAEEIAEKEKKMPEFFHTFVPKLLLKMIKSQEEYKVHYDAILIDEAQDFEADWFLPIMEVIKQETNSLLITCDGLQGIYARNRFTWSSVGIQARGRVKRFEKSYRTPIEIGILAQETLPNTIKKLIGQFDEFLSTKEFIGTHGTVEIIISETRDEEYRKLVDKIELLRKQPQEILVLFRYSMAKKEYKHPFFDHLKSLGIEWTDLQKHNYKVPGLLIGTLHGTKGLESDTIIIPELDTYTSDKDRQLLYVGITRSRKKLILSANKSTDLINSLKLYQTSKEI
jgi:superfamily I DNA/RNA helicase